MGSKIEIIGENGSQIGGGENPDYGERYRIALLRELDLKSEQDLKDYFTLLTHPLNIEHFSSPPVNPENLKEKLLRDKTHAYLAENSLGEVVGGGGINDAEEGQHDHWVVKVVVDPELQGKGVGKQLLTRLIEEAFTTKTGDGRDRTKLDASVIRNVDGWWRMPRILQDLGFRPLHIMLDEVDVFVQKTGKTIKKPTERWEIMEADWTARKQRADVREVLFS